jgi:hypothetical protein
MIRNKENLFRLSDCSVNYVFNEFYRNIKVSILSNRKINILLLKDFQALKIHF